MKAQVISAINVTTIRNQTRLKGGLGRFYLFHSDIYSAVFLKLPQITEGSASHTDEFLQPIFFKITLDIQRIKTVPDPFFIWFVGVMPYGRYHRRCLLAVALHFLSLDWPCLAVGVILLLYWGRVSRMAWKMRRKTGRAANFIPTEPLGKILRILWQPIVIAWIVLPLIAAFRSPAHSLNTPLFFSAIVQWIGVVIAVFSYLATRACWKRMGKSWRMGIDPDEKTSLVFTGAYAWVRHPIYALSSLLMLATLIILPTPIMIGVGVIHLALLQWEARREEQNLSRIHGQQYDQYRAKVGRFIPMFFRT